MPQPRPIIFSDCHGDNIVVRGQGVYSEGRYLRAHGQFITQSPLTLNQSYTIKFEGTGIIKFNTFPTKADACDWVRSHQPLPRGCKRMALRCSAALLYNISLLPGLSVLVEPVLGSVSRERYTLAAGQSTTLAFDIEYGDVSVIIDTSAGRLAFDEFCHSSHIQIGSTPSHCRASLKHYNPSSLCCLADTPLEPGSVFLLEVIHTASKPDSGSYLRICAARQMTPYENSGLDRCSGSSVHPEIRGKRILVRQREVVKVRVLQDGLHISRVGSFDTRDIDIIRFSPSPDQTLWFELHKASLRAWRCSGSDDEPDQMSFINVNFDPNLPPPDQHAPPPPDQHAPPPPNRHGPPPPPIPPRPRVFGQQSQCCSTDQFIPCPSSDQRPWCLSTDHRAHQCHSMTKRVPRRAMNQQSQCYSNDPRPQSHSTDQRSHCHSTDQRSHCHSSDQRAQCHSVLYHPRRHSPASEIPPPRPPRPRAPPRPPRPPEREYPRQELGPDNSQQSFQASANFSSYVSADNTGLFHCPDCYNLQRLASAGIDSVSCCDSNGGTASRRACTALSPIASLESDFSILDSLNLDYSHHILQRSPSTDSGHYEKPNPICFTGNNSRLTSEPFEKYATEEKKTGADSGRNLPPWPQKLPRASSRANQASHFKSNSELLCAKCSHVRMRSKSLNREDTFQDAHRRRLNRNAILMWVQGVNEHRHAWSRNAYHLCSDIPENLRPNVNESMADKDSSSVSKLNFKRQSRFSSQQNSSSFWLVDMDDQSVEHRLEIQFELPKGELRCQSYASEGCTSGLGSRCPPPVRQPFASAKLKLTEGETCNEFDEKFPDSPCTFSTESTLDEDNGSACNIHTPKKSVISDGFSFDVEANHNISLVPQEDDNSFDEITALKHTAQLETLDCSFSPEPSTATQAFAQNALPQPCTLSSLSYYCLAGRTSPCSVSGQVKERRQSFVESEMGDFCKDSDEDVDGDIDDSQSFLQSSQGALTYNSGTLTSDSGVVTFRRRNGWSQQNIRESRTSNCSTAHVSIGPTIMLPCMQQTPAHGDASPFQRTDTLRRNMDTSPRTSQRKLCSKKIKSTDCVG